MEEHVLDLLPGYALGALDEDDLLLVTQHLPHCPACGGELASFCLTVDHLALAVPLQSPSIGLKGKILQQVGATVDYPQRLAANPVRVARPVTPETHRWNLAEWLRSLLDRPVMLAFSALALLLVVFLAASNLLLWRQVNELESRIPGNRVRIVQMAGTEKAPKAQGYLMIFHQENYGTLVIEDAPPLEQGFQYQLWLIKDGKRTSGGVFSVNEIGYGTLQISAGQPLDQFPAFGVTIEPAGGSPGPTGEKVLGGNL